MRKTYTNQAANEEKNLFCMILLATFTIMQYMSISKWIHVLLIDENRPTPHSYTRPLHINIGVKFVSGEKYIFTKVFWMKQYFLSLLGQQRNSTIVFIWGTHTRYMYNGRSTIVVAPSLVLTQKPTDFLLKTIFPPFTISLNLHLYITPDPQHTHKHTRTEMKWKIKMRADKSAHHTDRPHLLLSLHNI